MNGRVVEQGMDKEKGGMGRVEKGRGGEGDGREGKKGMEMKKGREVKKGQ